MTVSRRCVGWSYGNCILTTARVATLRRPFGPSFSRNSGQRLSGLWSGRNKLPRGQVPTARCLTPIHPPAPRNRNSVPKTGTGTNLLRHDPQEVT